jgi:hypothetical protein
LEGRDCGLLMLGSMLGRLRRRSRWLRRLLRDGARLKQRSQSQNGCISEDSIPHRGLRKHGWIPLRGLGTVEGPNAHEFAGEGS